jgi:outer membrane lipoprotein LolB
LNFSRQLLLALFVLAVSACATQSIAPTSKPLENIAVHQAHLATLANIQTFSLKGRLGVVTQKQGFSGGIEWQHQTATDQVVLTDQKGQQIKAHDAEALTETTLGFRLPLKGLSDWAVGRPTTSKIEASSWDAQGRLSMLKQDGWDIDFENYVETNGTFLPSKIVLKSEKVNLKLLVENWLNTQ